MKTAKQITDFAQEVIDAIVGNDMADQLSHELSVATDVLEQIQMDDSRAQREYLTEEFFEFGSNNLIEIKRRVARMITQRNNALAV